MRGADTGTRERLATSLQQRHGNAAVQRLLDPAHGLPVQRWAVGLPRGTTDCERVVSYMNTRSPHRADGGWAKTRVHFGWGGDPEFHVEGGVITARVANPVVTQRTNVDMPDWSPSDPTMAGAWSAMHRDLRGHEAEHERIANEWEGTLRSRLESLTVTLRHRTLGAFNAAVQAQWNAWLREHQADQRAIDPYTAILDCAAPASGVEPRTEGDLAGVGEE